MIWTRQHRHSTQGFLLYFDGINGIKKVGRYFQLTISKIY